MESRHLNTLILWVILLFSAPCTTAKELKVAISEDAPPYVMDHAKSGLEIEVISQSLSGYSIAFAQMGWGEIQGAIDRGIADAEANVHEASKNLFYSKDYIAFINYAISKKKDNITINSVSDLAGHPIITWQGAHRDLGPEFQALFSPGSPTSHNYIELQSSQEQVEKFWQEEGAIIVIDISIFSYLSKQSGHSLEAVSLHNFKMPTTKFKMAFKKEEDRNTFDLGLSKLCSSGAYRELLRKYGVTPAADVCPPK
ncbi:substrate-binding periplasmic protein [Microbulbifer sp. CnH-101-G]|uniref:substrate-binding periplasmic protein n=1 Tax=Microbulbifer sp. CnH-101-G TaxID=3243393 RepID=UPI00403A496C